MWRQQVIWSNRLKKFRDNPRAIIPFLKKHLYYRWVADSYLPYYAGVKFLSYQQTIDALIMENRSFARFGDEAFDMIQGIGLYFNEWRQQYDPELARRYKQILSSNNAKLLIGFNPEFILMSRQEFKDRGMLEEYQYWVNSKVFLKDYINPNQQYGSTLCFQERYNTNLDYGQILKHLQSRNLIIVTSDTERFKGSNIGITTDYIKASESNAWDGYNALLAQTKAVATRYSKDTVLVLGAIGPATKVLAYDLTHDGYVVWDTGQLFDLALSRLI